MRSSRGAASAALVLAELLPGQAPDRPPRGSSALWSGRTGRRRMPSYIRRSAGAAGSTNSRKARSVTAAKGNRNRGHLSGELLIDTTDHSFKVIADLKHSGHLPFFFASTTTTTCVVVTLPLESVT